MNPKLRAIKTAVNRAVTWRSWSSDLAKTDGDLDDRKPVLVVQRGETQGTQLRAARTVPEKGTKANGFADG
jgi:hypothetical protein